MRQNTRGVPLAEEVSFVFAERHIRSTTDQHLRKISVDLGRTSFVQQLHTQMEVAYDMTAFSKPKRDLRGR